MDTLKLANTIRKDVLRMTNLGSSGHIGSVFSIADILAVLYGEVLSYDVKNPTWEDRDRFILSKGHAGAGIYAALARSGGGIGHQNPANVLGCLARLGNGHGLPMGILGRWRFRFGQGRRRTFRQKNRQDSRTCQQPRHLSRTRNPSRHCRHVRGGVWPARGNLRW